MSSSPSSGENVYELSNLNEYIPLLLHLPKLTFESSNTHLTSQTSNTNLNAGNEPLLRTSSNISSDHHSSAMSFNHRNDSRQQKSFQGWHVGVTACAATSGAVFVINTVVIIWVVIKFDLSSSIGILQEGNCHKTKNLGLWLHLAINVLSSLLLGASNYCMQYLSSPTRAEINKAHNEKRWLDIGVLSFKNLRRLSKRRITLWWFLALSSVPLHLMYNSAIFSTLSTQAYFLFIVDADFLTGSSFDLNRDYFSSIETVASKSLNWVQNNISSLAKLDNAACIKAYGNDYVSSYGDLFLVSSTKNASNSLLSWAEIWPPDINFGTSATYDWICSMHSEDLESFEDASCDLRKAAANADEWIVGGYPIDYCLARKNEEHCKLQFSLVILVVVILCNLIKTICMIVILWKERTAATLITLGDAISSFLDDPDPATVSCCLVDKRNFTRKKWQLSTTLVQKYVPKRHRWFRSASLTRWMICNVLCLFTLTAASILFEMGLRNKSLRSKSFSHLRQLGFGAVTSELLISAADSDETDKRFTFIFIANSPQLLLSFLYLNYNGLFTCMLLASEWSGFAHERKYLRVSSPVGKQRSSYRLQLPYIYGIPLLIISGTLHWLISQSIFLARIDVFGLNGLAEYSISTCGYSLIAIITGIALGSVVVIAGIVTGFRRYDAGMPLAGSCSAAISAACHPTQQDKEVVMSVLSVKWGAEKKNHAQQSMGHCSFSSFEVDMPTAGGEYM